VYIVMRTNEIDEAHII